MLKKLCVLGIASFGLAVGVGFGACGEPTIPVPILVYHRFGPVASNEMTITTPVFESQLKRLRSGGYTVIPLRHLVAYLRCQGPRPPAKAVVITA
ncbi:MAG TPA: hypothetical protein VKT29_04500, partial [Terriglobales bacterium]|nr:hypothetical protein [Terriglobales bacterium]